MSCGITLRRACGLFSISRSSVAYETQSARDDKEISEAVRVLAAKHPRFGYRRIHALLSRNGLHVNIKRVWRIWDKLNLAIPRRRCYRRRHAGKHRHMSAIRPNAIWAYDFVHDQCANGQNLKCFAVVDEFTRECYAVEVRERIRSSNVIDILSKLFVMHGTPYFIRCDNGPEFIANAIQGWLEKSGVHVSYIQPGRPWQNGAAESFNSKLRDECLNREIFRCRREARPLIENWRVFYNHGRPHSSLGYRTPHEARDV